MKAPLPTTVYIKYSDTHLYVDFGAKANMETPISALRNRDVAFVDDFVLFGIDTFGDGRSAIFVGSNADGSQVDTKLTPNEDDDSYDVNFESIASKGIDGFQVELKIPISNYQFSNEDVLQ